MLALIRASIDGDTIVIGNGQHARRTCRWKQRLTRRSLVWHDPVATQTTERTRSTLAEGRAHHLPRAAAEANFTGWFLRRAVSGGPGRRVFQCRTTASTTRPATTSGLIEHPAPNVEPGDVVMLEDGREGLVTTRVETGGRGPFAAFLEVVVAPTPFDADDALP